MKWTTPARGDIRRVIDKAHIYNRIINQDRLILDGHGSPITYWRNDSISPIGVAPKGYAGAIKCYCWPSNQAQPDKKHFVCQGTGWITHTYQKYGYHDHLWTTPSPLTKSTSEILVTGERGSAFTLSGVGTTGTLTTERIPLSQCKDVTHLLINDSFDPTQNRVEYAYSLDDVTWLPLSPLLATPPVVSVANKIAYFTIQENTPFIRFQITLRKRTPTSPGPKFNYIRFRYRQMLNFSYIDPRFPDLNMPAFLASRNNPQAIITQGEAGWTTDWPYRWWSLPEANIQDGDIAMFLQGTWVGQRSMVANMIKYTYGPKTQVTHSEFETKFIRDDNDLMGIAEYLI